MIREAPAPGRLPASKRVLSLLLVCYLAYYLFCFFYWSIVDTRHGRGDSYAHYQYGKRIQAILGSSDYIYNKVIRIYDFDATYPFTHALTMGIGFMVMPQSIDAAVYCNVVFLAAAFLGTFLIAIRFTERMGGMHAIVCLGLQPAFIYYLHVPYVEIAQTGMIALTYGLLASSRGLTRSRFSFAFAVACGFALLTKVLAILFLIPALLFLSYDLLDADVRQTIKRAPLRHGLRLVLVALIILVIAGPWYLGFGHLKSVFGMADIAARTLQGEHKPFLQALSGYCSYLGDEALVLPLFLCLLWSAVCSVYAASRLREYRPLALLLLSLSVVAISLVLLSSVPMQIARWSLPLTPFLATACAAPMVANQSAGIRRMNFLVLLLALASLLWNTALANGWLEVRGAPMKFAGMSTRGQPSPPSRDDWHTDDLASDIAKQLASRAHRLPQGIVVSMPYSLSTFHLATIYEPLKERTGIVWTQGHWGHWDQFFLAEWIVWKKGGDRGSDHMYTRALNELLTPPGPCFLRNHEQVLSYPLPDGSSAILLRRSRSPDPLEIVESVEKLLRYRSVHKTRPPGYFERYERLLGEQKRIAEAFQYQTYISQLWTPEAIKNYDHYSYFKPMFGNGRCYFTPPKGSWRRVQIQCLGPGADGIGPEVVVAVNSREVARVSLQPLKMEHLIVDLPDALTQDDSLDVRFVNDGPGRDLYIGNIYFQQ